MEIIKKPESMYIVCSNCKAELRYEYHDIKSVVSNHIILGKSIYKYIVCPCCSTHLSIK